MIIIQFEYYVLNYDFDKKKVIQFNIFRNIHVQECTEKAIRKYLRSPKNFKYESYWDNEVLYGFPAFVKKLDEIIKWQEWMQWQYEIGVGYAFEDDCNKLEKWDCYKQAHFNIEMIAREVIYQYKQQKKENGIISQLIKM